MKRFLSLLMLCTVCSGFAWAAPQASLTPVVATHQRSSRHRPHKAGRHHRPKRNHRGV